MSGTIDVPERSLTWKITMADDISLEYEATVTENFLQFTAFKRMKEVTKTLSVERKGGNVVQAFIHCNNLITVKRGATDIGRFYSVRRLMRSWKAPLNPADREQMQGTYALDSDGFHIDSAGKPAGDWYDTPGLLKSVRVAEHLRSLGEWVIGVEHPREREMMQGAIGLYVMVILDLTPTHYRHRMSPKFELAAGDIADLFGDTHGLGALPPNNPWKTEADFTDTQWAARHASWQDYSAINNQLPLPEPTPGPTP